ncbi:MAG: hypothetical protein QOG69_2730 [Actinomycetota bacterium]|nr:hypothetical protein [Actinomycetota bacterium]
MRRKTFAVAAVVAIVVVSAGCGGTRSSGGNSTAATAGTVGSGVNSTATARAKAVKFAECMRTNGVSAFPDPDASGALTIDAVANGSSVDTSSAAFKQAHSACKGLEPSGFTGHQRSTQEQKAALAFAQCIRDKGVADFPDPAKGEPLVDTNRIPSAATPGGMSILHAAMQKCGQYASAAGVRGSK